MTDADGQSPESNPEGPRRPTLLPLDRLTAFSDGVLAIVITILVLELAVPSVSEPLLAGFG